MAKLTYDDLRLGHFKKVPKRNYFAARYYLPNGIQTTITRARWIWEKTFGPVPAGKVVGHLNGNGTDDGIENLYLTTNSGQASRTHTKERHPLWAGGKQQHECEYCGKSFEAYKHPLHPARFCSWDCFQEYSHREHRVTTKCAWCGLTMNCEKSRVKSLDMAYCSRKCYEEAIHKHGRPPTLRCRK